MNGTPDPIVETAERLCQTLDRIGDSLVRLDADTLLDTEETLGQLLSALADVKSVEDKAGLKARIERAAAALVRCRQLGASFGSIAGPRLRLRTGMETYGRSGGFVEPAVSGAAVRVTT